jgi:hypothetical protein
MPVTTQSILPSPTWQDTALAHRMRAAKWTIPYRSRRAQGKMHPVHDFLFIYFRFAPSLLEHWHPPLGVGLEAPDKVPGLNEKYYSYRDSAAFLDTNKIDEKACKRLRWCLDLSQAVESKPAQFTCFGMHEWAMVYKGGPEGRPRHEGTLKLRLPQTEIDALVQKHPTCCSHFDAFRFFTEDAKPYNKLNPTQDSRLTNEQPGCLHTNMDLYKWTAKSMPWVGSELLWDTFEYAIRCREIDMRASPYDCTSLGLQPIQIETEQGRAEYEHEQRKLAEDSKPLRKQLIDALKTVLDEAPQSVVK